MSVNCQTALAGLRRPPLLPDLSTLGCGFLCAVKLWEDAQGNLVADWKEPLRCRLAFVIGAFDLTWSLREKRAEPVENAAPALVVGTAATLCLSVDVWFLSGPSSPHRIKIQ